jgi:hypothetical protein
VTSYVVLRLGTSNTWEEVPSAFGPDRFKAHSPEAAIKQAAEENGGTFVAVPARSWKPLTVKVEQTRRVTVSAAEPEDTK